MNCEFREFFSGYDMYDVISDKVNTPSDSGY
jgi:hypothetical protein